ncbi:MAG: lysophospholipid acyltransferase family protein [Acidithiobacillus sp.]
MWIKLLLKSILWFFAIIPSRMRVGLGRFLGLLAYWLMPRLRHVVERNLEITELCAAGACASLVKKTFMQLGLGVTELGPLWLRPSRKSLTVIHEIRGINVVEAAVKQGKGIILFTGHYGSWETLIQFLPTRWPITVLYRKVNNKAVDALIKKYRSRTGATMIEKRVAIKPLIRALKRGEVVGVLTDQNVDVHEGIFSPFFGRPASTSPLVARLATVCGSSIFGVYATRESDCEGVVIQFEPLHYDAAKMDDQYIIDQKNAQLERVVKTHPEQYWWFHKRYKAVALGLNDPYANK